MPEYKLKSCPFCGFRRPIIIKHRKPTGNFSYSVKCDLKNGGCGAETRQFSYVEDATVKWNMRSYENRFDRRRRTHNHERHLPKDTTVGK